MALTNLKTLFSEFLTKLKGSVVNNLASTATNLPLSANQGKVLDGKITALNDNLKNCIITCTYIVPNVNNTTNTNLWVDISSAIPYGYKFLCEIKITSVDNVADVCYIDEIKNNSASIWFYNNYSGILKIVFLCIKA